MENKTFGCREELCETLDKIVLDFFDTLADLYTQQALLARTMKSGFLNLSRARYSMGVKTVHIDQIDEAKMQAHVRVGVANSEKIDCDTNMFSLIHCKDVNMEGIEILTNNTEKDENQSGLRKRNVKVEDGKETSKEEHIEEVDKINGDSAENENEDNSVIEKKKLFDPIKWFGVLVPVSLKQSQIEFKKSVELVVNIGNLQTKLESLRENYWELLHLKKTEFSENER